VSVAACCYYAHASNHWCIDVCAGVLLCLLVHVAHAEVWQGSWLCATALACHRTVGNACCSLN
jgi:hypothetical protein